ncbi:MAG TPA: hypothetical protein VMT16_10350 [Thermoanaerobaculia bacterium]|nr:hypothetical protein [Thermoanaerobaculia bacterium]
MRFAHDVHRQTQELVAEFLRELFDDLYYEEDTGHFYVRYGSTVLEVAVEGYGPEEARVTVMAYCVQGVRLERDLLLGLLELNHHLPFGAFSLVGNDIYFSQSLFGRSLQRSNLLGAIAAVANISDEYDDRIVAKYGGQTALERIRDTAERRLAGKREKQETR